MISEKFKLTFTKNKVSLGYWKNMKTGSLECFEDGYNYYSWAYLNLQTYRFLTFSTYHEFKLSINP